MKKNSCTCLKEKKYKNFQLFYKQNGILFLICYELMCQVQTPGDRGAREGGRDSLGAMVALFLCLLVHATVAICLRGSSLANLKTIVTSSLESSSGAACRVGSSSAEIERERKSVASLVHAAQQPKGEREKAIFIMRSGTSTLKRERERERERTRELKLLLYSLRVEWTRSQQRS